MKSAQAAPRVLLFDFGGVLVDWAGIDLIVDMAPVPIEREVARQFWLDSPWIRRFETGRCSPEEFAEGVITSLDLEISVERFIAEFRGWVRGPLPGAHELLDGLKGRFTLACLSNTNPVHWDMILEDFGFASRLDRCYGSFLLGKMKPDLDIFEHVVRDLGCEAEKVWFFDDNPECAEAAREAGLRADCVRGVEELRGALLLGGVL